MTEKEEKNKKEQTEKTDEIKKQDEKKEVKSPQGEATSNKESATPEDKNKTAETKIDSQKETKSSNKTSGQRSRGQRGGGQRGRGPRRGDRRGGRSPEEREFDQRTLDISRVTRVTKGGKRMSFRSLVVIGNHKGKVGYGLAKGADVAISVSKSMAQAKKKLIEVPIVKETIPHEVRAKYGASHVLLKPAVRGSGIKAGGAVRAVLEVSGVPNVSGKILGSKNKINNVKATFRALEDLIKIEGDKKSVDAGKKESKKEEKVKKSEPQKNK